MQMVNHIYLQQCNVEKKEEGVKGHSNAFKLKCIKESMHMNIREREAYSRSLGLHKQTVYHFHTQLKKGDVIDPTKYMIHQAKDRHKHG